jgi:hypothetical protein
LFVGLVRLHQGALLRARKPAMSPAMKVGRSIFWSSFWFEFWDEVSVVFH